MELGQEELTGNWKIRIEWGKVRGDSLGSCLKSETGGLDPRSAKPKAMLGAQAM